MAVQYPGVTDAMLVPFRAIEALIQRNPKYLEDPACPYSDAVKTFLAAHFAGSSAVAKSHYTEDDLEAEVSSLYTELKTAGLRVSGVDPKDKIQLLKTSADLLTKMVALKERLFNVKSMSHFQRTVIEVLEGVCTTAQRSEFIERLSKYVQVGSTEVLGQERLGHSSEDEGEGPGA